MGPKETAIKKYNFWRSLLSLLYTAPVIIILFHLMFHHWPSWDLVPYMIVIWFSSDVLQVWRERTAERKRLAGVEQFNKLDVNGKHDLSCHDDKNNYV